MKKQIKTALLSTFMAAAMLSASTATVLLTTALAEENTALDTTRFEMVDGAAIRLSEPTGIRFIAELGEDVYNDLMTEEFGVDKKLGMFIVPYEYLTDESKYSNGATDVLEQNYENITTKIDHVFYDSADSSVENKIYEEDGYYRINGVITNLYLQNHGRDFIGIAYIAETTAKGTAYTYAEFDEADNVRNSSYVAIEAYPDYTSTTAQDIFKKYVLGAYLAENGMTEPTRGTYLYQGTEYDSINTAATAAGVSLSVAVEETAYAFVGETEQLGMTFKNGETDVTFDAGHAIWSSSNEAVATVDANGNVKYKAAGETTITAKFLDGKNQQHAACTVKVIDGTFETLTEVPDYMTKSGSAESIAITSLDGNKVLQIKSNTSSTAPAADRSPGLKVTLEFLKLFFDDENVDYVAFDAKAGTTTINNFCRVTLRSDGTFAADCYEHDMTYTHPVDGAKYATTGIRADSWKTFYFSRADYDAWVAQGVTSEHLISTGDFNQGDSIYVDNIRPVTAEERAAGIHSFESGGVRINDAGGVTLLFYTLDQGTTWQFNMQTSGGFTNVGYTNEDVTDGIRALQFTKPAGNLVINLPSGKNTYNEIVTKTGYWAMDIFVPENSDASMSYHVTTWPGATLKKGGWTTIYVKSNNQITLTDTTGGTYKVDNIRSITEAEYNLGGLSMEANVSGVRTQELGDATANQGVFYYYGGADHSANKFSFAFTEGNASGDLNVISNVRLATEQAHDGTYSLAFDKGSGYMSVQMRSDSTAYSLLSGGFSFWIYSTTAINGTTANNFINGVNGKFNGGAGITIPANTWTKVVVTAEDMNPTRFLIMQGSWAGTVYIDDIQPVQTTSVTLDANGGTCVATQSFVSGEEYILPTPTSYRDFLGWYDENGKPVPTTGIWTAEATALTAKYADKVSFEDGVVPTYLTKAGSTESLSVVTMDTTDGDKALKIQSTASGTSPALYATVEFLASFFEDESVDYIAFNAKTGSSRANNFRRYTMHSNGSMNNVTYEYDIAHNGIYADAWKTFYFSREDYNYWVANSVTANSLIATGGFNAGDCIYLDNIRAATAEEYADGEYGMEIGGVRLDGNNLLFYTHRGADTWQWGILPGAALTSYAYTNVVASDGVRSFSFTQAANTTTTLRFNTNTVTQMQTDVMGATGYYAFDLYVPRSADVTLTYQTTNWPGVTPKKGGWTTIYVNNNTTFIKISDTTGSTYAVDNFRSVTAEEYTAAMLGFEANTGGLRDDVAASKVFYYYSGADHTANKYSICASGSTLTEVHLDDEIVHGGDYSLAFTKTNGALTLQMRADSAAYESLHNGFTFWIYSTVGLNGISANNFINGNSAKFNGGEGMSVSANTWTQVTVTADDIVQKELGLAEDNACPFLRLNGSTAGTIYIDDIVALPYEEPEVLHYNTTVETEADGVRSGIVLGASTHTNSSLDVLPQDANDTEDMSYIKFGGNYGLGDFLVFDFTGDNLPLMSFFTTEVTNTVYNQDENADVKGWIVANGMRTMRSVIYGGSTGATANRLNFIGPYMINGKFDDTPSGLNLTQNRLSYSPSPLTMATLQDSTASYRIIIGWVENGTEMNLIIRVIDLASGGIVIEHDIDKDIPKADWDGDIALYGHFGKKTVVDALYPIEEDTTISDVLAKYMPNTVVYNGTWNDNGGLTLEQSTYTTGSPNKPGVGSTDMSYVAFNGSYGLNDYVVFDMTGTNMPIVSFFNNEVTNTVFNNSTADDTAVAADANARGWVLFNGLYNKDGSVYGGAGGTHSCRLTLIGYQKVLGFDNNANSNNGGFRVCLGSTTDINPISITGLTDITDTYRIIIGIGKHASSTSKVYVEMGAINMVTGAVVYQYQWEVSSVNFQEGSIALHGQFGKTTVLDKVFGVEQDTTLSALIAKYAKDSDYSDEAAVALDRYAYSSLSDGQWTLDGTNQVTSPTDYRTLESTYTTYKNAGFNILLAQDMISTDGTKATWEASANKTYMDNADNAGLKVILTDWHLQILSAPLKVSGSSVVASDSTYVPWIIGTDVTATTGAAADYLGYLSTLKITVDSTRFATRDALDKFVYDQLAPYKDHPAFYGVMLADEPSYHNAYCYGEVYKSIKRVMPDCYVQYNLLPMEHSYGTIQYRYPGVNDIGENITNAQIETAYKSYVESFLDTMGTDYIQYDDYPFKSAEEGILFWTATVPYVDPTSLRNIQLVAEIAKERGLSVKVVSQSCVMKSGGADGAVHIRQITEADARWLNNYLTGFGVKQINYFTYWTKRASTSDGEYFVDGGSFVNRDGETTALYTFMQTIMADNTKFAPTISHFDYNKSQIFGSNNDSNLNNEHISWSSSLTAAASFRFITGVTTNLEYTLVTELYDADRYNYLYMVMNTIDPNSGGTQSITVTLDRSVTQFYVYDQSGNRTLQTGKTYTVSLTAGQAVYIMPCAW